jgi:hypothetical protein
MAISYDKSIQGYDDPAITAINRCIGRIANALRPGAWQVDYYPWLKYIPGYLKELQDGHQEELSLFNNHLGSVRARLVSSPSCLYAISVMNTFVG